MHTAGRLFSRDCGKEILFWKLREEGGRVLPGGASPPNKSIGVLEKNFQEILRIFGNWREWQVALGGAGEAGSPA
jgi:hypothetical protein